jgi:hypothetical protein
MVDRIAGSHHGLITLSQLRELGFTEKAVRWAVADGRLQSMRPGVFRVTGARLTRDQAWMAAVLATDGRAVLSHGSAAVAWALKGFRAVDGIDLLVEGNRRVRLDGVRSHWTSRLPSRDRTRVRAIPVTTGERTLVDACGLVHPRALGRSVDDALRRRIITLPGLVRCAASVPLSGRRKSRPIREVLGERVDGYDPGGSAEELDVMKVLRRHAVRPLPRQQYRVKVGGRTFLLDYAWPETRHALEYLGAHWHGTPSAVHDDSERTRLLQRDRWTLWPLTKHLSVVELLAIADVATDGLV